MPLYRVNKYEVWVRSVEVRANSDADAITQVQNGNGTTLWTDYSRDMPPIDWDASILEEDFDEEEDEIEEERADDLFNQRIEQLRAGIAARRGRQVRQAQPEEELPAEDVVFNMEEG